MRQTMLEYNQKVYFVSKYSETRETVTQVDLNFNNSSSSEFNYILLEKKKRFTHCGKKDKINSNTVKLVILRRSCVSIIKVRVY